MGQTRKTFTLGVLYPGALDERRLAAIRQGLAEGFGDDRRVAFQARSADGHPERLATMAAELVGASVDVIFAIAPAAISAVRATATRIPIVALDLETDPVAAGWIQSIARPGGNLTGIFFDAPEVAGKWIQLIREAVPARSRIGVLWDPGIGPAQALAAEEAARRLGLAAERISASTQKDLGPALERAAQGRGVLVALSSPISPTYVRDIAGRALQLGLPGIMMFPEFARVGGLIAYGPDNFDLMRQSARIVVAVLQGTPPATRPIERPARLQLLVNVKTAKALGVTFPQSLLLRADQVVE